jgi:glycerol uptake facilitator-like aquaporin
LAFSQLVLVFALLLLGDWQPRSLVAGLELAIAAFIAALALWAVALRGYGPRLRQALQLAPRAAVDGTTKARHLLLVLFLGVGPLFVLCLLLLEVFDREVATSTAMVANLAIALLYVVSAISIARLERATGQLLIRTQPYSGWRRGGFFNLIGVHPAL